MTVWVVIPWAEGSCGYRIQALEYVTNWWTTNHPDWPVRVGAWPRDRGPWRKGCAIRAAGLQAASDDVVIVADADVIPAEIDTSVARVMAGPARWAMPFRIVYRLTEDGTWIATNGGIDLKNPLPRNMSGVAEETYVGTAGGGLVVLRGDVFNTIPIDPRFAGYGQEDLSWGFALGRLAGAPIRATSHLWHLWHPPQPRMRIGKTVSRGVGSEASLQLARRYRQAATPATMRALLDETLPYFQWVMGDAGAGAG